MINLQSYSQEKISEFKLAAYDQLNFEIFATEPELIGTFWNFDYYIDVPPIEPISQIKILIANNQLEFIKNTIVTARNIYSSWKQTAIENNVDELYKEVIIDKQIIGALFLSGDWFYDNEVTLKAFFRVHDNKYYLIFTNETDLQAWNKRIKKSSKGFILPFSTEEEINEFLDKLTPTEVKEYFISKKNKESIFKQ